MNILCLDDTLCIINKPANVSSYDFDFELLFQCTHPIYISDTKVGVLRIGAIRDYDKLYEEYFNQNIKLINSPEHIVKEFGWPVFIKGSRQTSKHNPELCIAHNADQYIKIAKAYKNDPILHWQDIVIRQFVPLMSVEGAVPTKIKPSLEFRTFWWKNKCVGYGPYWYQLPVYEAIDIELGLSIAQQAAERLNILYLVIDLAKTQEGSWIIIECNDAQESGYTGVYPQLLWQNILSSFKL